MTGRARRPLIVGGGGMLGRMLAAKLAAEDPEVRVLSVDLAAPPPSPGIATAAIDIVRGDLAALVRAHAPDAIYHLAAIVSAQAEAEFDLGYAVNVDGTRRLLEAARASELRPRFVFASSLAVYGGALPDIVPDGFAPAPRSSYGAQKAIGELLVADYARKGHIAGVSIRLPTVVVRPGAPNRAALGFLSSIVREPVAGKEAVLPIDGNIGVWIASPRVATETLLAAANLPDEAIANAGPLIGRGVTTTPDEVLAALGRIAGPAAPARVCRARDSAVEAIVASWPKAFACDLSARLGLPVDASIDAIVREHVDGVARGT